MKVLLDEDLPVQLTERLRTQHDAAHVARIGWKGRSNGELLREAVVARFDVLVTGDSHLSYQQDLRQFDIAVIHLRPSRMVMEELESLVPELLAAISTAPRQQVTAVPSGSERSEQRNP